MMGQVYEPLHFRVVKDRQIFESHVPHYVALARETPLGVRELGSLQEAQRHPAGKEHDRKDRQRGPLVRPETDHQPVVVVIDQLDRAGEALSQFNEHSSSECCDGGIVLGEERVELLFWTSREFAPRFHT